MLEQVDVLALHAADERPTPPDRPWLMVNMIASVDGATAIDQRSGGLGGPADKVVFRALRAVPDAILVGAATVRTEGYGPVRLDATSVAMRVARGQSEVPRLVIVSGSLDLDVDSSMFGESTTPPLIFTGAGADPTRCEALGRVAEVVQLDAELELHAVLRWLRANGTGIVLCEGGPLVNGQLIDAGLVDEWCQTISPILVAGTSTRVAHSPGGTAAESRSAGALEHLHLDRLLEQDGMLFARYVRSS